MKDATLLWLWCRPAAAAPIRPPSLGTSICPGYSPKKQKKKKIKEKKKRNFSLLRAKLLQSCSFLSTASPYWLRNKQSSDFSGGKGFTQGGMAPCETDPWVIKSEAV